MRLCWVSPRAWADFCTAIDQYVREFQLLAEGVDSKAGLVSSIRAGEQRLAINISTSQKRTAGQEDGSSSLKNKARRYAGPKDIIDLTTEEER